MSAEPASPPTVEKRINKGVVFPTLNIEQNVKHVKVINYLALITVHTNV